MERYLSLRKSPVVLRGVIALNKEDVFQRSIEQNGAKSWDWRLVRPPLFDDLIYFLRQRMQEVAMIENQSEKEYTSMKSGVFHRQSSLSELNWTLFWQHLNKASKDKVKIIIQLKWKLNFGIKYNKDATEFGHWEK